MLHNLFGSMILESGKQLSDIVRANQPIGITGSIRHVGIWLWAGTSDVIYYNPNYVPCDNKTVMLAVHGTADTVDAFRLLSLRLKDDLPSHIECIHVLAFAGRARGHDITHFVDQLDSKIQACGYQNVILAGHSRGALVVADYAVNRSKDRNVKVEGVLAICGPFNGSMAASIWPLSALSTSVQQMQQGSDYLNTLCATILTSEIPFYYFASSSDELVSVDSAIVKNHNASIIILDRHSHLSILSSFRLRDYILDIIKHLPRAELTHQVTLSP